VSSEIYGVRIPLEERAPWTEFELEPMVKFTLHNITEAAKKVFGTGDIGIIDNMSEIRIQLPAEAYNQLSFEKINRFEYLCRPAGYFFSYTEKVTLEPIEVLAELKSVKRGLESNEEYDGFIRGQLSAYSHAIELVRQLVKETM